MARIRSLKPEFWADEKLSPLPPIDRLVFIGLISQADDAGRLIDNPRRLDGLIFPETQDTCANSLDTLARLRRIIRYTSSSGQKLIQIAKWEEHQRVDKPSAYVLPAPTPEDLEPQQLPEDSEKCPDTLATLSQKALAPINDQRSTINDLGSTINDQNDVDDGRARTVREVIMAANQGMVANRQIRQNELKPILASAGDSQQYVTDWLDAGIPPDVIVAAVTKTAHGYKPKGRSKQIHSMSYFDDAVRTAYERQELRRGNGNGNGSSETPARRNGAVPGKGSSGSQQARRRNPYGA